MSKENFVYSNDKGKAMHFEVTDDNAITYYTLPEGEQGVIFPHASLDQNIRTAKTIAQNKGFTKIEVTNVTI